MKDYREISKKNDLLLVQTQLVGVMW